MAVSPIYVVFNKNDGSQDEASLAPQDQATIIIPNIYNIVTKADSCDWTREGYDFLKWNS
jgi:hypothetical protein